MDSELTLGVASANGRLLRFVQSLAQAQGWSFRTWLASSEARAAVPGSPPTLLLIDVFLEDGGGLELLTHLQFHAESSVPRTMLVAPGCESIEDLAGRLDSSQSRPPVVSMDEAELTERIRALMGESRDSDAVRARNRYSAYLQITGEACHTANQPMTSLLCNLELMLRQELEETSRARLQASYESAVKIMKAVQSLQRVKWLEEKDFSAPIHLLSFRTPVPESQPLLHSRAEA